MRRPAGGDTYGIHRALCSIVTKHTTSGRRWVRRIGIGVAVLLGAVVVLLLAFLVAMQTAGGRRFIVDAVLDRVNDELPGSVTVACVDALGLSEVRGRGLRVLEANGHEVLRVDRFIAEYSLSRALAGELVVASAKAKGGRVIIEELPNGHTRFEDAVSRAAGPRTPTVPFDFRRVEFSDLELVIRPDGTPAVRIRRLHGALALRKLPMSAVRVDFMGIDGILRAPGWGSDIGIRRVHGRVDADAHSMLELRGKALVASDDPCPWRLAYGPHPRPWMRVAFEPTGIASTLLSGELHVAATFSSLLAME